MKHNFYALNKICIGINVDFQTRIKMLLVMLFCSVAFITKAQHQEDTTIVLPSNAFTIGFVHTPDSLLKFEIVNNQLEAITPFFIEIYVKGYSLNAESITQSLNNAAVPNNIEKVFGPQFVGFGLDYLPPLGNYKTSFYSENKTNEASTVVIRISGTINGQHVIWSHSYNN
ncbi:MAG: hypothetical protein PSX81_07805 [bacterium]|nr:hypothetical protein [bacterium]